MEIIDLKKMQDCHLATAQQMLLSGDEPMPLAFVVSRRSDVSADEIAKVGMHLEFLTPTDAAEFEHLKTHDIVTGVVPRALPWRDQFNVIYHSMDDRGKRALDLLTAVAPKAAVDENGAYRTIVQTFKRVNNLDEQDIANRAVITVAQTLKAFAIIQITEAYFLFGDEETRKQYRRGRLSENPKSKECLVCSLESRALRRLVIVEILREGGVRDTGKVLGFGLRQDMTNENGAHVGGRLVSLLSPLPGEQPAS